MLKIVAERKVPEHLKKCAVARRLSYIFNIPRADTFLAGRHARPRRDLLPGKIWFQRGHPGIDEQ